MSIILKIKNLNNKLKTKISKDLTLKIESKFFGKFSNYKYFYAYKIDENDEFIFLPFFYSICELKLKRPKYNKFTKIFPVFKGKLREEQKIVANESIKILNDKGSVLIAAFCGFGKTCLSLYLINKIKLKTLIITHRIVLMQQWLEAIRFFLTNFIKWNC